MSTPPADAEHAHSCFGYVHGHCYSAVTPRPLRFSALGATISQRPKLFATCKVEFTVQFGCPSSKLIWLDAEIGNELYSPKSNVAKSARDCKMAYSSSSAGRCTVPAVIPISLQTVVALVAASRVHKPHSSAYDHTRSIQGFIGFKVSFELIACLSHAWTPGTYVLCLARPVVNVLTESCK